MTYNWGRHRGPPTAPNAYSPSDTASPPPPPPYTPFEERNARAQYMRRTVNNLRGTLHNTQRNASGTPRNNETSPLSADFSRYGYQARRPQPEDNDSRSESSISKLRQPGILKYIRVILAVTYVLWIVGFSVQTHRLSTYPPTPDEFDAYKAKWDVERVLHKQDYDKWAHDRAVFEEERRGHEAARREHELDEGNWVRQRRAYEEDTERWRRAMDGYELAKRKWAEEQISWARERTRQQRAWREEQERWAREREERDKDWRDEAGRHRMHEGNILGLSWGTVDAHQCVRYGTREYTARLGLDTQEACQHMPIVMNGEVVGVPHECIAEGDTLVGRWFVKDNEVECRPSWGDLYDKGCMGQGSGKRRFEARLWNLHDGEDWTTMCATTPADIHGRHFDSPTHCENRGAFYGMVGMWDVDDYGCK